MKTLDGKVIPEGTPTQIAHKWRTVKRTVAVVIAGLVLLNGIIALVLEVFDPYLADTPLAGWLLGASALFALIVTFLQRLMVVEGLQEFLGKIGLGTGVEQEEEATPPAPEDPLAEDDRPAGRHASPPTFND